MAAPAACFIVIRCYLVCSAAAMPLAKVSNCSLVRSVVAWRMRVMAKLLHCDYCWLPLATKRCLCYRVTYCDVQCQSMHWGTHEPDCRAWFFLHEIGLPQQAVHRICSYARLQ